MRRRQTLHLPLTVLAALAVLAATLPAPARPNDGAAEVAAGGIQLRSERRVAMRKEQLFISLDKVEVAYEFVNESSEEVVSEIAFPTPDQVFSPSERIGGGFYDFRAWVDGEEIAVTREVRAFVGDEDVSAKLLATGFTDLAHSHDGAWAQWDLPKEQLAQLHALGLVGMFDPTDDFPVWSIRVLYHWQQRFPPGKVVRIRHAYTPATGMKGDLVIAGEACVEPALARKLREQRPFRFTGWVRYILTTASTWKTPIGDFTLTVDLPPGALVSFCWDGKVQRTGPNTFTARAKDFVPRGDLAVYYFAEPSVISDHVH